MTAGFSVLFAVALGIIPNVLAFSDNSPEFVKTHSSSNSFRTSRWPYVDLTDALNRGFGIANTLNRSSYIYYSTDFLITQIPDLAWIAKNVSTIYDNLLSKPNASFCLMIAFQMTKNHTNIDWKYIEDIFNQNKNIESPETKQDLQILRKHLCHVALDFQVNEQSNKEYIKSRKYAAKNDISFTKYAKQIVSDIFGAEYHIPVGVIYSEFQVGSDRMLLEQEIRHADFTIVNVNYHPVTNMPLEYFLFKNYLNEISDNHTKFICQNKNCTGVKPVEFMLTWNKFSPSLKQYTTGLAAEGEINVYISSEAKYLNVFKQFARHEISTGKIAILSGTNMDSIEDSISVDSAGSNLQTYLYVQKSDTSACQLGTMLNQISRRFETLVVNEYTWSALASFQGQMTDKDYMKDNCKITPRMPKDVMLLASHGIGDLWNDTGKAYENLLWDNPTIGDLNLTTLVFAADDIESSLQYKDSYGYTITNRNSNVGIKKFLGSWVEANISRVGCLVDISNVVENKRDVIHIVDWTETRCSPIFDYTSVVVWQISIRDDDLRYMYNRTYKSQRVGLNEKLMNVLVAKEVYSKFNPSQEIVLSLTLNECFVSPNLQYDDTSYEDQTTWSVYDWEWILFHWASIHDVKMLSLTPAFDPKSPLYRQVGIEK